MSAADSSTLCCPASLGPRVRPFVHRPQSITSYVSVDLRRTHIGVSEQLLNSSEIGAALEQVRRVGMPQSVRMQGAAVGERDGGRAPAASRASSGGPGR